MQTFLTETLRQEKLQTKSIKKRNLFGLGLTSLIAACSGAGESGSNIAPGPGPSVPGPSVPGPSVPGPNVPGPSVPGPSGPGPSEPVLPADALPFEVEKAEKIEALSETEALSEAESEFTATSVHTAHDRKFTVAITDDSKPATTGDTPPTLTYNNFGRVVDTSAAKIYKLTATENQYDLVVSSPAIDDDRGSIFIFWNVSGIKTETFGETSNTETNPRLEIKRAATQDNIAELAPEFLQIGGTVNNYDIVFTGRYLDRAGSPSDVGAIYILWDVANYAEATKTIDLDNLDQDDVDDDTLGEGATSGSLAIYGAAAGDKIGISAPDFLQIAGKDEEQKYDMVIRSHEVNRMAAVEGALTGNEGAIYILWNVADYYGTQENPNNKVIDLGNLDQDDDMDNGTLGEGATAGSLAIYGAAAGDQIGIYAPDFLQIGGKTNNYDMVIRSKWVDKTDDNEGAIYILWDVADYTGNKIIDLGKLGENEDPNLNATSGSLTIYGARQHDEIGRHAPDFLQIAGKDEEQKYDMVIRSEFVDNGNEGDNEGAIYILWDVADYTGNKIIDLGKLGENEDPNLNATSGSLTILGAAAKDHIGTYAPEFLQIAGKDDDQKYDMVIRSYLVDKTDDNEGAIYILWDVADYTGNKIIDLDRNLGDDVGGKATAGSLTIYGAKTGDQIGRYAPEFLQIGNAIGSVADDQKYDMIIRSHLVDNTGDSEGAIYVLWDVADYYSDGQTLNNKVIDLGKLGDDDVGETLGEGATSGSLAIYGAKTGDLIGRYAPEFLQIGGTANNYDMVIRSHLVDKTGDNKGAIYVLWDVADYVNVNKTIILDHNLGDNVGGEATAGSLAIYGAKAKDQIGINASKFLQIAGKDDNQDMIIRSEYVDKTGNGAETNEGAIYILWDVADYYGTEADKNKSIDLITPDDASSGLLTIYGREGGANLGSGNKNILYNADGELTNIGEDETKDIALTDGKYTYILFGNQIAETNDDGEVISKTIDLGAIETLLTADTEGFFGYNFDDNGLGLAATPASTEDRVGYRFADDDHTTLAEVQTAYTEVTSGGLSDTDADLGVWDIA